MIPTDSGTQVVTGAAANSFDPLFFPISSAGHHPVSRCSPTPKRQADSVLYSRPVLRRGDTTPPNKYHYIWCTRVAPYNAFGALGESGCSGLPDFAVESQQLRLFPFHCARLFLCLWLRLVLPSLLAIFFSSVLFVVVSCRLFGISSSFGSFFRWPLTMSFGAHVLSQFLNSTQLS